MGTHQCSDTSPSRSSRFFQLPTWADTGNCSVERPCFLSDHIRPPCTEHRGNRLKLMRSGDFKNGSWPVLRFRSVRFFELPTSVDTGNCSVERPCFLSDHNLSTGTKNGGVHVLKHRYHPRREHHRVHLRDTLMCVSAVLGTPM